MRALITSPIPDVALERIRASVAFEHYTASLVMPRAELLSAVRGVTGLYCMLNDRIDAELLDAAGDSLRVVSTVSVGFDHIDVKTCAARGIAVGNTPGVLSETCADLTLALLLATARRLPEGMAAARSGAWGPFRFDWLTGYDLYGATVGIIGMGGIGQAVARRLKGFSCRILYTGTGEKEHLDPSLGATYHTLEQLLAESDFVTIHCPYNAQTHHLINRAMLARMKSTAILINTARGGIVDQEALWDALTSGTIAAAGLDVTTPEPLPADHPLQSLPNCVILPHIGSASIATRYRMALMAADNLIAGVHGLPLPNAVQV